jgi:predicted nucleotidyltransferase
MNKPANKFVGLLAQLRRLLPMLRVQYHVGSVEVFGSFVRGDDREGSDLDLIVTLDEVPTLFEFLETENYLSDELGIRVDLVMKDSLKPAIGKRILEEAQPV